MISCRAIPYPEKIQSPPISGSRSHSSVSALFLPVFNLFGKEVKAQRTRRLIKAHILAFKLIALHKKIPFKFRVERVLILQGNSNILRHNSTKIVRLSMACHGCSLSIFAAGEHP